MLEDSDDTEAHQGDGSLDGVGERRVTCKLANDLGKLEGFVHLPSSHFQDIVVVTNGGASHSDAQGSPYSV